MTFSYESTAPESSARSYIRLVLGQTSSGSSRLEDEEIDAFLSLEGTRDIAAAHAADAIGAGFASSVDKSVGKLKISMAAASDHFFTLANRLRYKAASRAAPYAGGINSDDKLAVEQQTDRVEPAFTVGMHDFTGANVDESTT